MRGQGLDEARNQQDPNPKESQGVRNGLDLTTEAMETPWKDCTRGGIGLALPGELVCICFQP